MNALILSLLIACGEKTESASSTSSTTEGTKDEVTVISLSSQQPSKTSGSIEIKAILPEKEETSTTTSTTEDASGSEETTSTETKTEDNSSE